MKTYLIVIAFAVVMVLLGGSCKHDPPVGPKAKCDTCITPCDTCKDTTHRVTSNDTTSHNFVWTQSSISGEAGLSGCWVFGTSNIYTVGGSLWKFNGSAWKEVSLIDADRGFSLHGLLSGCTMFAFSETDYWLTDGFPAHSNGSKLTQYRIATATQSVMAGRFCISMVRPGRRWRAGRRQILVTFGALPIKIFGPLVGIRQQVRRRLCISMVLPGRK
jgi:hypothetical protein